MTEELKPCPFCGWNPPEDLSDVLYPNGSYRRYNERHGVYHYVSHNQSRKGDEPCWSMHCTSNMGGCGAEISADSQEAAISAWNRRPPTIPAEVGRRAMEALTNVCKNFPTDFDMADLGWDSLTVETACTAYDKARAAITELQQYLGEKK